MKTRTRWTSLPVLALGLLLIAATGARASQTATLEALISGQGPNGNGTLVQGDKVFSLFGDFTRTNSGGADAPTTADIEATTFVDMSGNIGLVFSSAKWNVNPGEAMDTGWGFTVTAFGADIIDAELAFRSYAADGGSDIHITESLSNGVNLVIDARSGPTFDHHTFSPVHSLRVFKDVSLEGHANGSASLSTFTQTFSQTPEPGTIATAAMGVLFAGITAYRRRTRKQA